VDNTPGEVVLSVQHLSTKYAPNLQDISFDVREGEIFGLYGLVGAGRSELLETMFGVRTRAAGRVYYRGRLMNFSSSADAMAHGFAMITEERKSTGLFLEGDLTFNTTITNLSHYKTGIALSTDKMVKATANEINVMRTKTSGEDKELEALLMRQDIFVDYFDDIYVYGEKKRTTSTLNEQRGRWASQQFTNLFRNIRFLPGAIFRKQYNLADKLIQWMLVPRTNMIGIIMIMSLVLPFIYLTMAIKWWILGSLALFIFALATPDYLVDEVWDKTFLRSPFVSLWKMFNFKIHKKS
jgi:ABC-type iron transport system FetAB ATPase subunit